MESGCHRISRMFLKNNSLNKLYTYAVNLSPAIEMGLWKGGKLTAQVVFPIAANYMGNIKRYIRA